MTVQHDTAALQLRHWITAAEDALPKWLSAQSLLVAMEYDIRPGDDAILDKVSRRVEKLLAAFQGQPWGDDLIRVVRTYWLASKFDNGALMEDCLAWLRGEMDLESEAARRLGVARVFSDSDGAAHCRLLKAFLTEIGMDKRYRPDVE